MTQTNAQILVISSHVIFGAVGTRTTVCALEHMGFAAWPMLTVSMTWQPKHGRAHRVNISDEDFAGLAHDIANTAFNKTIGAIMTGYFISVEQVKISAKLIQQLKAQNSDIIYLLDPVIGDEKGPYIAPDVAEAIVRYLIPLADIFKPNRSELEWICQKALPTNDAIYTQARQLTKNEIMVTSAWPITAGHTGNLLIEQDQIYLAEHPMVANPVNGLGDMTAALYLAKRLTGASAENALMAATASVYGLLEKTMQLARPELAIEYMSEIIHSPHQGVVLRHQKPPLGA